MGRKRGLGGLLGARIGVLGSREGHTLTVLSWHESLGQMPELSLGHNQE